MIDGTQTLAHISDLHLGRDPQTDDAVRSLAATLIVASPDAVLVTGDVTHRGRRSELASFERLFAPLASRLVVVPGNHDRAGDDVSGLLMAGPRVAVARRPGLHLVRLDSTAPHNRSLLDAHGEVTARDVSEVEAAMAEAEPGRLAVLMLHHHVLELPGDHLGEALLSWLGWPHAAELARGPELVARLRGRCDLVLHGHRHAAATRTLQGARPLRVLNAGSAPELGALRLLTHAGGRVLAERWLPLPGVRRLRPAPRVEPLPEPRAAA